MTFALAPDMAKTLQLHVGVMGKTRTLTFEQFPVRIGRDATNECQLAFPKVSRLHARLELHSGRLVLRDEGSTHGTFVRQGEERVAPRGYVPLHEVGDTFWIGPAVLHAELRDDDGDETLDAHPPQDEDTHDDREGKTHHYDQQIDPSVVDALAVEAHVAGLLEEAQCGLDSVDGQRRAAMLASLASRFSWISGPSPTPSNDTMALAAKVALRALRELAEHHLPLSPPLASAEAVLSFATRLDEALRVLVDGVTALRAGYRSEAMRGDSAGVCRKDLGALLLDWTASSAVREVQDELLEMLAHHARLVEEVDALAPEAIASACPPGTWLRSRWAWREYCARYRRTHDEGHRDDDAQLARVRGALGGVHWETAALGGGASLT